MGPVSGPSMDQVFLKNGGTGTVKQFRHVLVPPAFAKQHAMRMHLAVEHYPPPLYEKGTHEDERMGTMFNVAVRDESEHDAYADEPFMEDLAGQDMFDVNFNGCLNASCCCKFVDVDNNVFLCIYVNSLPIVKINNGML